MSWSDAKCLSGSEPGRATSSAGNDPGECPDFPRLLGLILGAGQLAHLEEETGSDRCLCWAGRRTGLASLRKTVPGQSVQPRESLIFSHLLLCFGSALPLLQEWLHLIFATYNQWIRSTSGFNEQETNTDLKKLFVVQSLNHVWLIGTPWTAAWQACLSFPISLSLLQFMSIELVMLSSHLVPCCPLFLLSSIIPSIRVFSSVVAESDTTEHAHRHLTEVCLFVTRKDV